MQKPFLIRVEWDEEAAVWTADRDDVPGLATEADTVEALSAKLRSLVPELLILNGVQVSGDIDYELLIRRFDRVRADAA